MISIVIPSYNRRDGMLALLADIYRQEGVEFEVIVVDDCSLDDSIEAIRREFPSVKVFVNPVNGGPAATRNRGILEASGEIIVGFDSDVTLPDRALLANVAACFGEFSAVAGLAMHILKPDGKSEDIGRWWHPLPVNGFAERQFFTSYFSGTAYALRRDVVIGSGLFPELLYMHYEEVELAWRVLDNGGRILYSPSLIVIHHANIVSLRREVEVFLKPRNQVLIAVSCLPLAEAVIYVVPRIAFQFIKACLRGRPSDFIRAMRSTITLLPRQVGRRKPLRRETLTRMRALRADGQEIF